MDATFRQVCDRRLYMPPPSLPSPFTPSLPARESPTNAAIRDSRPSGNGRKGGEKLKLNGLPGRVLPAAACHACDRETTTLPRGFLAPHQTTNREDMEKVLKMVKCEKIPERN